MNRAGTNPELLLKASARPETAAHQWSRLRPHFGGSLDDCPSTRGLLALLGNSSCLVDRLLKDPGALTAHRSSPYWDRSKPLDQMLREAEALFHRDAQNTAVSVQKRLREFKYAEMTRIAGRDLAGLASFEEIGEELSSLASACVEMSVRGAAALLQDQWTGTANLPPFTVLGLGKLGGQDLNFSSDIDVIYVHDNVPSAKREAFEFFCRYSETVTKLLHERTHDGIVFRVDLDLRPEGKSGVIVNSWEALVSYYEISGAPWERGALIKARPVAGDEALGRSVLKEIEPFVFPKLTDGSAIRHLQEMKAKINAELKRSAPNAGYNLKLGRGGIREIEFFAMAFQMVYGGKEPRLRERNTLKVLSTLQDLGLVPSDPIEQLKSAYVFLRRAENRLQMDEERQTHSLPKDKDDLVALARRCGYPEVERFLTVLEKHTDRVAAHFENLAS